MLLWTLCLLPISVSGQKTSSNEDKNKGLVLLKAKTVNVGSYSEKSDSLSYDELIDDYLRLDNELTEKSNQLLAEKTRSKYLADKLESLLLQQKKLNKKQRWLSVRQTIKNIGIGLAAGCIIGLMI